MAAKVILIEDRKRWETVREFLRACGTGAVVLGPDTVQGLKDRYGPVIDGLDEAIMECDYGGEADILLDWHDSSRLDHYSMDAIREHLGLPEESEDDLETGE